MTLPASPPVARRTGSLRAALFDMDGLLVDSEPVWSVSLVEIMKWLGGPWNLDVKELVMGRRVDEACRVFVEMAGSSVPPEEVQERVMARMSELYREELPLLPGALELVEACRAAGVRTALVSSTYRELVDVVIETLGAHRFDVTVAGDEVERAKPAPEPYERAAAGLGVHPGDCVVLEDSLAGVESGEAAGCAVVGVPGYFGIPSVPGRLVVPSLTEVSVGTLRDLVASRSALSSG